MTAKPAPRLATGPGVSLQTPNAVSPRYAALGATTAFQMFPPSKLRLYLVGKLGAGKSTWIASRPGSLHLDFQNGAWAIPHRTAPRIVINNYKHYCDILEALVQDGKAGKREFDSVSFDPINRMALLIEEHLYDLYTREGVRPEHLSDIGGQGKGYELLYHSVISDIRRLEDAGYGWTAVAHLDEKEITVGKNTVTVLREGAYPGLCKLIRQECDYMVALDHSRKEEKQKLTKVVNGREITIPGESTFREVFHLSVFLNRQRETKYRVRLPSGPFEVSRDEGWAPFEEAYVAACQEFTSADSTPSVSNQ